MIFDLLFSSNEVSGHLNTVQDELDMLKDLLRNDIYSLDQATALGVSLPVATISSISPTPTSATRSPTDLLTNVHNSYHNIYHHQHYCNNDDDVDDDEVDNVDEDDDDEDIDSVDENMENDNALIDYLHFTTKLSFLNSCNNYLMNGNQKKTATTPTTTTNATTKMTDTKNFINSMGWNTNDYQMTQFHCDILDYFKENVAKEH